jgi:hypothetical protein
MSEEIKKATTGSDAVAAWSTTVKTIGKDAKEFPFYLICQFVGKFSGTPLDGEQSPNWTMTRNFDPDNAADVEMAANYALASSKIIREKFAGDFKPHFLIPEWQIALKRWCEGKEAFSPVQRQLIDNETPAKDAKDNKETTATANNDKIDSERSTATQKAEATVPDVKTGDTSKTDSETEPEITKHTPVPAGKFKNCTILRFQIGTETFDIPVLPSSSIGCSGRMYLESIGRHAEAQIISRCYGHLSLRNVGGDDKCEY